MLDRHQLGLHKQCKLPASPVGLETLFLCFLVVSLVDLVAAENAPHPQFEVLVVLFRLWLNAFPSSLSLQPSGVFPR